MTDLSWRFARASDIDQFYGYRPSYPINAAVVVMAKRPVGIVGVSREHGTGLFFSDHKDELLPHMNRMPVLRAIQAVMGLVRAYPRPVYAATETEEGHRILRRLGFTQLDDETYQWIWQPQD